MIRPYACPTLPCRLCGRLYNAHPVFIITSATISNPAAHAASLLGCPQDDIALVDEDGSPAAARSFVLWNPPLTEQVAFHWGVGSGKSLHRLCVCPMLRCTVVAVRHCTNFRASNMPHAD